MKVTTLTDYALRALVEIASRNQDWVTIEDIASNQDMSEDYLRSALNILRRAGIVVSRRGREGGFALARSSDEIYLGDVIRAVDGPLTSIRGLRPEGIEYLGSSSGLEKVWIALRAQQREVLDSVSIQAVVDAQFPEIVLRYISES